MPRRRDAIRYEELGPQGLPGREEPVDAYRALEALTLPGRRRVRDRTPLIGREVEMGALSHTLALAVKRRRAQLVVLIGDAGVGKSRLAKEVAELAMLEHGAQVLGGACVPYGDANPFGPIAEALRQACEIDGAFGDDADAHARLRDVVARRLGLPPDSTETDRVVEGLLHVMEGATPTRRRPRPRARRCPPVDAGIPRGGRRDGAGRARHSPTCTGRPTRCSNSASE